MSTFYPSFTWAAVGGRERFPHIDLVCALMPASFKFNPEHKTLADVREHIIAGVPLEHSLEGDVLDAKDAAFQSEASAQAGSLVIFAAIGAPEASPLLAFLDLMHGLPLALAKGATVTIAWDNGPKRIALMDKIE